MADLNDVLPQVKRLSKELDKRVTRHEKIEPYLEGECPLPPAVTQARLTKVYRHLMPVAEAPWGSLIVDAKLDRLEVSGLRDADEAAAKRVWSEAWQPNSMDSESKLAHAAALLDGRCYATVWADSEGKPDIALDDVTQMVLEFAEGSRRKRTAALRRWSEGEGDKKTIYATLYRPDGLYKFQGKEGEGQSAKVHWEKRVVEDEEWPLELPERLEGTVPVVEIAVNRRLKPGRYPHARGEFAHCTGLIDRINLLTFLGLVVAIWMGFPLRGILGGKIQRRILRDDDDNPLVDEQSGKPKTEAVPPFDAHPDSVFQVEGPDVRLAEFQAADRKNLSIFDELQQLAVISKTPRHYFPMEGGISNIATETVNAYEGAMHAAVTGHKSTLGEGWEEVNRLCGRILGVEISQRAEMVWMDHESRSLAERADAASKLKDVVPAMAIAELALNATQEQISRWQSQRAVDPLMSLIEAARSENGGPTPAPAPVPGG